MVNANMQHDAQPVAVLAKRPYPFDSVVGYEEKPPGAAYPRGPRKVRQLGTIEWNWGPMHERVRPYYLHRARRHWALWTKVPDEWGKPHWMPLGYVPLAQATEREAAVHLVADSLRFEKDHTSLDQFDAVTSAIHLPLSYWDRIRDTVWPAQTVPPSEESFPFAARLPVPPGEERRVVAVAAALHDPAFRWEETDHSDARSRVRSLESIAQDTVAAILGDPGAMRLLAFLGDHLKGLRSGSGMTLPQAEYTVTAEGGVTFNSEDGGARAISVALELSFALPWYYERKWTPEADQRLRAYLARPGYVIPKGTGTREAASSMAAVYMALTGKLASRPPHCMSYVIGRWIELIQDEIPQEVRDDTTWRDLLPLAAGTGREREYQRLAVVVEWTWETVLPTLERVADKYDLGTVWRHALTDRSVRAATAGARVVQGTALATLGDDFSPARDDVDDLWNLCDAAKAARETAVASSESEFAPAKDIQGCVDAAVKAATAASRTGVPWQALEPVAVLQEMIDA